MCRRLSILVFTVFLSSSAWGQDLVIDRPEKTVSFKSTEILPRGWVELSEDLYRCTFRVPPSVFVDQNADPFAVESKRTRTAREMLESRGIEFKGAAKAVFHAETSTLIVDQCREQMEIVRTFIGMDHWNTTSRQVIVILEIFELGAGDALQVLESVRTEGDHTPERQAVVAAMKEGKAKLIASPSMILRSGMKGEFTDGEELHYPREVYIADSDSKMKEIVLEERMVGTILSVSSQIGPMNRLVDLNIDLEHHTAPANMRAVEGGYEVPIFHVKTLLVNVSVENGDHLLLGTWKPSGKPEYEDGSLTHLVFVSAVIQTVGDYGQKVAE